MGGTARRRAPPRAVPSPLAAFLLRRSSLRRRWTAALRAPLAYRRGDSVPRHRRRQRRRRLQDGVRLLPPPPPLPRVKRSQLCSDGVRFHHRALHCCVCDCSKQGSREEAFTEHHQREACCLCQYSAWFVPLVSYVDTTLTWVRLLNKADPSCREAPMDLKVPGSEASLSVQVDQSTSPPRFRNQE